MSACYAPLYQAILNSPTNYQVQVKVDNGKQLLLNNLDTQSGAIRSSLQ